MKSYHRQNGKYAEFTPIEWDAHAGAVGKWCPRFPHVCGCYALSLKTFAERFPRVFNAFISHAGYSLNAAYFDERCTQFMNTSEWSDTRSSFKKDMCRAIRERHFWNGNYTKWRLRKETSVSEGA